ncbi:hypothetical protein F2Q70_00040802 [Brassica cretica]|nr:hypothetical protein F2Q70_00040802 [Brassica cretica]
MIFGNKKQFASNGFDFVQKQRNQRKRQNKFDDDEKWIMSGDCPFTKAKRSNRDVSDQNELQTYASLEKMIHKTIHVVQQLKKKGNTNTSSAPKQQNHARLEKDHARLDLDHEISQNDRDFSLLARLPHTARTGDRTDGLIDPFDQFMHFDQPNLTKARILHLSEDIGHTWSSMVHDLDMVVHTDSPTSVVLLTAVHASGYNESGQKPNSHLV